MLANMETVVRTFVVALICYDFEQSGLRFLTHREQVSPVYENVKIEIVYIRTDHTGKGKVLWKHRHSTSKS